MHLHIISHLESMTNVDRHIKKSHKSIRGKQETFLFVRKKEKIKKLRAK